MAPRPLELDGVDIAAAVGAILNDCLYNVIYDTVLAVHRDAKLERMQSAATQVQMQKEKEAESLVPGEEQPTVSTDGATMTKENKIFLTGDPFTTTPEVICPNCRLPRLSWPTQGRFSRPPEPGKKYCAKQPYIEKEAHDIYGKSLKQEKPSKKKVQVKETKRKGSDDGSGDDDDGGGKADKPASTSMPSGKCPNCPRYMAFTRIAHHMDRCLGISGRSTTKNAANKLNGSIQGNNNSNASGTPQPGSHASTPKLSHAQIPKDGNALKKRKLEKGSDDEDEKSEAPAKKKVLNIKNGVIKVKPVNAVLQKVKGAEKRPPDAPGDENLEDGDDETD